MSSLVRRQRLRQQIFIYSILFSTTMNKKLGVLFLFLLSLPLIRADLGDTIKGAWQSVISVGSLQFLGVTGDSAVVAFTRILIVIFVFAVLFGVLSGFGGRAGPLSFLSRGQAGVVAGIIALITGIFFPASVLLALGTEWATLVALLLLGTPIFALFFLLYSLPDDSCPWRFLKLIMVLLLLWIIGAMQTHVLKLAGKAVTPVVQAVQQFITWSWWITALIGVYYLLRLLGCGEKKPRQKPDLSGLWDWIKRKMKGDDDDKDDGDKDDDDKKKKKKRQKGVAKAHKFEEYLVRAVDVIKDCITKLGVLPWDAKKINVLYSLAKRHMTKTKDGSIVLDMAKGTPLEPEANAIVAEVLQIRKDMNSITSTDVGQLKALNTRIGIIIKRVGKLIEEVHKLP